ncbi:MAG: hypothetical protein ACR2MQ_04495 [Gemmatimonadaceae bacterium]
MKPFITPFRRLGTGAAMAAAMFMLAACNSDKILKVTDPDIINPNDIGTPDAAEALRIGALGRLSQETSGSGANANNDSPILLGGLLADEWRSADTFNERDETDKRSIQVTNGVNDASYRTVGRARLAAHQALAALTKYSPEQKGKIAQMYFILGFSENLAGETYCNGVVFSDASSGSLDYGAPVSDSAAFTLAIVHFDSALALATGTDAISTQAKFAAQVGKGRALINLKRYSDAAAAVAGVPTSFQFLITHDQATISNQIWSLNISGKRYTVGDKDGGNGLPFVSAKDPRLPTCSSTVNAATCKAIGVTKSVGFDSQTPLIAQLIWTTPDAPVAIVTGIEARLIEAEAALQAGNNATWLATLNTLRGSSLTSAGTGGVSGLGPLTDPGTQTGREDLMFRERAFWMFGTGHRLGDLRRLIRQYQRSPENVFPTGTYNPGKGGNFGTDVNIPVPQSETNNSMFTACTDRKA